MIVHTKHSVYTFAPTGVFGVFTMISTNKKYKGPWQVVFTYGAVVGHKFACQFRSGPKRGRYLISSPVTRIEE